MRIPSFKPSSGDLARKVKALEEFCASLPTKSEDERLSKPSSTSDGTSSSAASTGTGGGSGSGSSTIPESSVVFDPTDGHVHDDVDSNAITLAGDVSGLNTATTVDKIKNAALPATPGASQSAQVLRWNNGTPAYEFSRFTNICPLGAWVRPDISTLAAADGDIDNAWAGVAGVVIANPMPVAGGLIALSVKLTGDVGAAGNNLIVTVYKNGVATALAATVTGGAGTEDEALATDLITFSQGDDIKVQARIVGAPAAVRAVAVVWGYLNT